MFDSHMHEQAGDIGAKNHSTAQNHYAYVLQHDKPKPRRDVKQFFPDEHQGIAI